MVKITSYILERIIHSTTKDDVTGESLRLILSRLEILERKAELCVWFLVAVGFFLTFTAMAILKQ